MQKQVEIKLLPTESKDLAVIKQKAAAKAKIDSGKITEFKVVRRSIDARFKQVRILLRVDLYINEKAPEPSTILSQYQKVDSSKKVIIIGAGPAGYFAALQLIEEGLQPILIERGKDVRARRRDLKAIQQSGIVNPHSNYCYGEGGAGTYSDGKLYTRSHKRGNISKVLELLVEHGANPDILVDAHPHIGSNKLPGVVAKIRETILNFGGEIHFDSFVTDFIIQTKKIIGVRTEAGKEFTGKAVILATGHSARDIFKLLHEKGVHLEAKPFALGLRIEHPQPLIDKIQYNQSPREAALPASAYRLNCQVEGRGVFSFCMCPGGLVVPAATAPGEIVVNGMSLSRRDSAYANSGVVVSVEEEDMQAHAAAGVFAAMEFQKQVEQRMFAAGDGSQKAPALRLIDFVEGRISNNLPESSYIPGLFAADLNELLPSTIAQRLREGLRTFGKKMKGYYTQEAVVIGTESRTSSPIRIPRSKETFMHEDVEALFPCGEGAGYAGGILSAAMDGQNVAKAVANYLN